MRREALVVLVLASVLAGCTGFGAPPAAREAEAAPELAPAAAATLVVAPDTPPAPPAIPLSLALDETWLKPLRSTTATLVAPPDARVAWFVALEEEDPRVAVVDGAPYALKSSTPDRDGTLVKRVRADVPDLQPDGRGRALRFDAPGQYALDAAGARLAVNVWPAAPAGRPTQAFLVEDASGLRFVPDTLDVAPGARVVLWSQARAAVDVRERAFAAFVPGDGARVTLTAVDEGLYRMRALVVDARGGRGEVSAPFLVDFERPDDRLAPGRWRMESAFPGAEPPDTFSFTAQHALRSLEVRFVARSTMPVPPAVDVELLRDGETLASASSKTATSLRLDELPPGDYVVRVTHREGALVATTLEVEGRYRLPTPARLATANAP